MSGVVMNFAKIQFKRQPVKLQAIKRHRQQGFVLILSLVMLTMLTLIGVSSMNSSNIELKATANAQHHQVAFNAVQSMLEFTLSKPAELLIDYQTIDDTITQTITHTLADTSSLAADVVYIGCSAGLGSSLEEGKGFSFGFYRVAGSGSNATGTATSLQTQGVRFTAAAC